MLLQFCLYFLYFLVFSLTLMCIEHCILSTFLTCENENQSYHLDGIYANYLCIARPQNHGCLLLLQ